MVWYHTDNRRMRYSPTFPFLLLVSTVDAWMVPRGVWHGNVRRHFSSPWGGRCFLLSDAFFENDLVAIQPPNADAPRLCAVRYDGSVAPLCIRADDVETDLLVDPREYDTSFWSSEKELTDDCVVSPSGNDESKTYGEGFYGQRPVPSLGGGPGYGAEADDCWSVDEDLLERVRQDGVLLPVLDMGIAHGEKARAGAF